jgi:hypothetical protein
MLQTFNGYSLNIFQSLSIGLEQNDGLSYWLTGKDAVRHFDQLSLGSWLVTSM